MPHSATLLRYDLVNKKGVIPKSPSKQRQLHALYFVLASEEEILKLALRSLVCHCPALTSIHIVMDKDRPLTPDGQHEVCQLFPTVQFQVSRYKMAWGGPGFMISKLEALRKIYPLLRSDDYLISLDPDVLIYDKIVFDQVLGSRENTIGHKVQPHQNRGNNAYMQGGCYFLSTKAVRHVIEANLSLAMWKVGYLTRLWIPNCPEDFLISEITKNLSRRYLDYMSLAPERDPRRSVLHFTEGNKLSRMRNFLKKYDKLISNI